MDKFEKLNFQDRCNDITRFETEEWAGKVTINMAVQAIIIAKGCSVETKLKKKKKKILPMHLIFFFGGGA